MNCTKCDYPIFVGQPYEIVGNQRRHSPKCPEIVKEKYTVEKRTELWSTSDTGLSKDEAQRILSLRRKQHPKELFRVRLG